MSSATPAEVAAARLILASRWGALATSAADGRPLASMVAYATDAGLSGLLLFLSGLSEHTRNLIADPRTSLVVSEPDTGTEDPQILARVSVKGEAGAIDRSATAFESAWGAYVASFPYAAPRLGLGDFSLFRIAIDEARFVGGFARATTISGERLSSASAQL